MSLPGFHGCLVNYLTVAVIGEGDDVFWGRAESVGYC